MHADGRLSAIQILTRPQSLYIPKLGWRRDGILRRFVHHQVPPKVDYSLTDWGQALCPALDALLKRVDLKETLTQAPLIALDEVIAFEPGVRKNGVDL